MGLSTWYPWAKYWISPDVFIGLWVCAYILYKVLRHRIKCECVCDWLSEVFVLNQRGKVLSKYQTVYHHFDWQGDTATGGFTPSLSDVSLLLLPVAGTGVFVQGVKIMKLDEFKYLGSSIRSTGQCTKQVKTLVQSGSRGVIYNKRIAERVKGKL